MLKLALQTMQGEMFRLKDDLLMDEDAAGQLFQFQTSTEPFAQVQGDLRDLNKFDIKVDTSTLIPEDRTSRANTFLQLFQMQIIDKEDLLDALDIPNRKRIIEKLRAREEGQIALAQQQGLLPQEPQGQGGF